MFPLELKQKINNLRHGETGSGLRAARQKLTANYSQNLSTGKSSIASLGDAEAYALVRMPATYAVISDLIQALTRQNLLEAPPSIIDAGAGTGSAYFALKECFPDAEITAYDRDKNMCKLFEYLSGRSAVCIDLSREKLLASAELVISSYMLMEMRTEDRLFAFRSMLSAAAKYVLIVGEGTPATYRELLKLKPAAEELGFRVAAPCMCVSCPLDGDYCQFYARLERSAELRQAKSATQSYEDEKYFYLLFEKAENSASEGSSTGSRVIRRPNFFNGGVELVLCSSQGVTTKKFTKKDPLYKAARKCKINDIL